MPSLLQCFVIGSIALAACASPSTTAAPDQEKPKATSTGTKLHFAWPTPGKARVLQTVVTDGERVVTSYDVVAVAALDGEIHVQLENFEFVEMDGADLNEPAVKEQLEAALAMTSAIPTMRVGADGKIIGFIGMDEMIDATLQGMKTLEGWADDDPAWLATSKQLRSPAGRAQVQATSKEFWRIWVGLWANLDLPDGSSKTATTQLPMSDGSVVPADIIFENHGTEPSAPSLVRLTATTRFEGDQARDAMRRVMAAKAQQTGGPPFDPKMIKSVKRKIAITATTDPQTLVPRSVKQEKVVVVETEGKQRERREVHEYEFKWTLAPEGEKAK